VAIAAGITPPLRPAGLELVPATAVQVALLAGPVYNLECVLGTEAGLGDHVTFIDEIVAAHWDEVVGGRLMNVGERWTCAQEVAEAVGGP
jgi:flavin reductase (DIM6/NTAB) family NADH-FMN oxidoreductase RutF